MIRVNQIKLDINHSEKQLIEKVAKTLRISVKDIDKIELVKKSVDARKKPDIKFIYALDVYTKLENKINKKVFGANVFKCEKEKYTYKPTGNLKLQKRPVIVGMGPCGIFCAYLLALNGYKPIVLERGKAVEDRQKDVEKFWETGVLDVKSNVQFGEGGAGTFSDGKLNTVVKDKGGRNKFVMETFHKFGASEEILYMNKPHIGTDVLSEVVKNMRKEIINLGGEVRFSSQVTDFIINNNRIDKIVVNDTETIETEVVILAIGHSARDTFETIYKKGFDMQAKNFAVGVRIQHPQEMIDQEMYGLSHKDTNVLKASDYKLTGYAENGRSVFSFCMCPGGYVVNASSEEKRTVVNGMSYSDRNGENANSAIIVSVTKEDYIGDDPLSGMRFQRMLEEAAYKEGNGNIPVQQFGDYERNVVSTSFGNVKPCIKGKYEFGNIKNILPDYINDALTECIHNFAKSIKGFDRPDAIFAGVESRTSSPVRINRDDNYESNILGVYPCGEGAGYAGGITSAAMDGIRVFEAVASKYAPFEN